ncbi:MAG: HEAT repeat domain-containing protein, partial [bacterium]
RRASTAPRRGWRVLALCAGLLAALPALAVAQPSAPGLPLLASAERAPLVVVGRLDDVAPLDASAFAASLRVTRVLRGDTKPGATLTIAWEEPGRPRTPRLAAGQTVLVALEVLPSQSLWRARAQTRPGLRLIAGNGDAFWPAPAAPDVGVLAAYLALPANASAAARASALARLCDKGSDVLTTAGIAHLAASPALTGALDARATATLMHVAGEARRALNVRRAVVVLAGNARLAAAAAALERLTAPANPLAAAALTAVAQIRGGLPPAQVQDLLEQSNAQLRAVGARYATGGLAERRLPALARADSAPEVRIAAIAGLTAAHTVWGVDGCLPALADADPSVRSAAARALGGLGAAAVPALEDAARGVPALAPGAVAALALAGPSGAAALRRLAQNGPNESLRALARLALGKGPDEH